MPKVQSGGRDTGPYSVRCQMIKRVKEAVEGRERIVLYLLPVLNPKSYDGRRDRKKWATEEGMR